MSEWESVEIRSGANRGGGRRYGGYSAPEDAGGKDSDRLQAVDIGTKYARGSPQAKSFRVERRGD